MTAGRGSKYRDGFKRQVVAESRGDGVSVAMVSKRHGVAISPIYGWRSDARFQADAPEVGMFAAVEIADPIDADTPSPSRSPTLPVPSIEITLENARKPVVSDGVDAGFILVLARGLAV